MSCCKKKIVNKNGDVEVKNSKFSHPFIVRLLLYLFITSLAPLLLLVVYFILFRYFFITEEISLTKSAVSINKTFNNKKVDESEEVENENNDSEDYEYHEIYTVEKIK